MSEIYREDEELEEVKDNETAGFVVDDDQKAEWCLEKIREHKRKIEKWTAHYEAEKKRACMLHENKIFNLETKLREYFGQLFDAGLTRETKTMTAYNLPDGKLMMKRQNPEFERDDDALIEWLRKNAPQFIKTKETVDWACLKDTLVISGNKMCVINEDGVITDVPGITVTERPDIFKVEVK